MTFKTLYIYNIPLHEPIAQGTNAINQTYDAAISTAVSEQHHQLLTFLNHRHHHYQPLLIHLSAIDTSIYHLFFLTIIIFITFLTTSCY